MNGWFITGTDTGCGKTAITLGLMAALQRRGIQTVGMKPVASGAEPTPAGPRNEDALLIQTQGSVKPPYTAVNPYLFDPPIAPHLAARQAGAEIDLERIRRTCVQLAAQADRLIVEGVGGWRVPLGPRSTLADLARLLDLPVILVVGLRLGCLNHALLTAEAIARDGLFLAGWVANRIDPAMREVEANIESLRERLTAPLLGVIPHLPGYAAEKTADALDLAPLLRQDGAPMESTMASKR